MIDDCEYRSKGKKYHFTLSNTNDLGIATRQAVYTQTTWRCRIQREFNAL